MTQNSLIIRAIALGFVLSPVAAWAQAVIEAPIIFIVTLNADNEFAEVYVTDGGPPPGNAQEGRSILAGTLSDSDGTPIGTVPEFTVPANGYKKLEFSIQKMMTEPVTAIVHVNGAPVSYPLLVDSSGRVEFRTTLSCGQPCPRRVGGSGYIRSSGGGEVKIAIAIPQYADYTQRTKVPSAD